MRKAVWVWDVALKQSVDMEAIGDAGLPDGRPIRVLHVIVGLKIGGAELMLRRLITGPQPGMSHAVVSLTTLGPVGEMLRREGVPVEALGMKRAFHALAGLLRLRKIIQRDRPDIIQTWMYHADFLGGLAAWSAGRPVRVWNIRATDIRGGSRPTIWLQRLCALLSSRLPTAVIYAAHASRQEHERLGYAPRRSIVLGNGFETAPFERASERRAECRGALGFGDEDIVIGWVGRFHLHKDVQTFIAAAGQITARTPNAKFLLVGRGIDQQNAALRDCIEEAGIRDRVTLLGEQSDVAACYAAMDIFCLSSRTEAFPNVLGEAMATALPAAVTDVGDAAALLGDAGIVAPRQDPERLAQALSALAAMTSGERREMGRRAQQKVIAQHDIARVREEYRLVYASLIRENGVR